ncbi:hypothetical protein A4X13_0g5516 [Tilletia indica]|uniref:DNA helicase n=1 Tax=Tilletia indica TaxID=43049 RepID=A0A177TXM9_9BASI|nr:hypothetical protein A4X13_0g5516 [Tilletia indica]
MSRSWRSSNTKDEGDAGSDAEGDGGGETRTELMDWDQIAHASTKDIVLFCIDAGPHMHKLNPDTGVSFLHSALLAAAKFQETKLITSPNDQVGIMLFGTETTNVQDHIKKGTSYSHCLVLQKIEQVDVLPLAEIYDLLADDERGKPIAQEENLGTMSKLFRIEHALGNAVHYMIAQGKTGYKRIFFMTNDDDPTVYKEDITKPGKSTSERTDVIRKCLRFVNEAGHRNIELEPLFISSLNHTFDVDKFYANVFAAYDDPLSSDPEISSDSDSDTEDEEDYDLLADLIRPTQGAPDGPKTKAQRRAARIARQSKREQREARHRSLYDCSVKLEQINQNLEERQMPKRVVFNSVMEVGEGIHIGIKGYSMFQRATRGTPVRMVESSGGVREVAAKVIPVCEDTGQLLHPKKDIETAFSFGAGAAAMGYNEALLAGRQNEASDHAGPNLTAFVAGGDAAGAAPTNGELGSIPGSAGRGLAKFTKEEMREMREMGLPHGIRILGFKPQDKLEFWMSVKHSVFIYPTDDTWSGSKRFFASLLLSMANKKVFAVAICLPRAGQVPSLAALWPREEEVSDEGVQMAAPGMFMIPLPFADDMRDPPVKMSRKPTPEEFAVAAAVVRAYTRDTEYHPDRYHNPALALHYATLRSVAFNRERPKTSKLMLGRQAADGNADGGTQAMDVDGAAPDVPSTGTISSILRSITEAEELHDETLPEYENIDAAADEKKVIRRFNELILNAGYGSVRGAPPKFKKRDEAALKEKWRAQALSTYKVTELKAALEYFKQPVTGLKAELVARLEAYLVMRWSPTQDR